MDCVTARKGLECVVVYAYLPHGALCTGFIRKLQSEYRTEVARNGVRKSKVWPPKQEAKDWAARTEPEILYYDKLAARLTLGQVFVRSALAICAVRFASRCGIGSSSRRVCLAAFSSSVSAGWP